jgi:hypothetical protein
LRGIHSRLLLSFLIGPIGWLIIHFCFRSQGSSHWARLDIRDCLGSFRRVDVISIHAFLLPPVRALLARESFWQVVGPWHVLVLLHKCPHCGLELS